ncbi:hypothetical protein [Hyphococcus luteus]|uniref:Nucleotide modification associated domain-containing protein n=1 Tax=Hyphococcus luteus TaxID=2058213 RepID=A0A2S7K0R9_9PROT|nr:hypothetical protein [Marinicaulis flavus]PQA86018.1 hypothetical protein CW354_16695 [Marinicaulis flavus]
MPILHSYIVAYDSGFAPNPFNGFCTLATCKPDIRQRAVLGDWIIGTGSNRKGVRRGGFLVYAMRVREALTIAEYWNDPRFEKKKPNLHGSYRMACGDNIYYPLEGGGWGQLNSYHSKEDGSPFQKHINRDTSVDRVLVSDDFVYFGAEGPNIPVHLKDADLVLSGRGRKRIEDEAALAEFEGWLDELGVRGYQGRPFDMVEAMRKRK